MNKTFEGQACGSLCQHPECWKANLQQVKEAVYRRNGVEKDTLSRGSSAQLDQIYLAKEQRLESAYDGLPTLKVVDMLGDVDLGANSAGSSKKPQLTRPYGQTTSLPSLSPDLSRESEWISTRNQSTAHAPRPTPSICPSALTDYQRGMLWKKQVAASESSVKSEGTIKPHKIASIGVHELYDADELNQEWQEVYITSAYLVWCPSNKKKRKRTSLSRSSSGSSIRSSRRGPRRVVPRDVTEDFVPAAMETFKPSRPKSTKTPTGGQPYSPYRGTNRVVNIENLELNKYGMGDLADLPRPVLSGILRQLNARNISQTEISQESTAEPKDNSSPRKQVQIVDSDVDLLRAVDLLATDSNSELTKEVVESNSRMKLAVDINSRFTTPEEDEKMEDKEEQGMEEKEEKNDRQLVAVEQEEDVTTRSARAPLPMHTIGIPTDDIPARLLHHCSGSIPRRFSLGAAMEPVELVPITPSPGVSPVKEVLPAVSQTRVPLSPLYVTIPSGEAALRESSYEEDDLTRDSSAYRFSPSPVRAPAPTPISPDKSQEYFRPSRTSQSRDRNKHSSGSYGRSSTVDDDPSRYMRRWETLSSVYDVERLPEEDDKAEAGADRGNPAGNELAIQEEPYTELSERVFLTEGPTDEPCGTPMANRQDNEEWPAEKMIINLIEPSTQGRSPSPGSKTHIPKDIIEQFHGDLYGRRYNRRKADSRPVDSPTEIPVARETKGIIIGTGITIPGWRQPRSRTPLQFSESPGRYAPKPMRQPPLKSIPKSLRILPILPPERVRPKSTPPRMPSVEANFIADVLSDSSLHNSSKDNVSLHTSIEVNMPSSVGSSSGAVPPPPSPEVPNIPEPAVGVLEPLREEDERSSIAPSVADTANRDADFGIQHLSPVGGESEDGSVDSLADISDNNCSYKIEDSQGMKENGDQVTSSVAHDTRDVTRGVDPINPQLGDADKGVVKTEQSCVLETGKQDREVAVVTTRPSDTLGTELEDTNEIRSGKETLVREKTDEQKCKSNEEEEDKGRASPKSPSNENNDDGQQGLLGQNLDEKERKSNDKEDEGTAESSRNADNGGTKQGNMDKNVDGEKYKLTDDEEDDEDRASPRPPGSPELTSDQDFTEGLDLDLDLEAELRAAMEGLDVFNVDDEDDGEMGVDNNIEDTYVAVRRSSPNLEAW